MNLDEVIAQFETEHKGAFSKNDREKIIAAMESLDLNDFFIRYRKDVKLGDGSQCSVYFRDNADEIHVHPTMIVARSEFEGSDRTIRSKYRQYPHIAQLSGWISKDDTARPTCPNCFLQLPLVGLCGRCEFDINDFRDE